MRDPNSSLRQESPQWGQSVRDRNGGSSYGGQRIASPSSGRLPIASPSTKAVMRPTTTNKLVTVGVTDLKGLNSTLRMMRTDLEKDEFREMSTQSGRPKEDVIDLTGMDDGDLDHIVPKKPEVRRMGPNRYRIPVAPTSPRNVALGQKRIPPSPPSSPSPPAPSQQSDLQRLPVASAPGTNVADVERRTESTHARSQRFSENISNRLRQIYDSRPEKGTGSITTGAIKRSPQPMTKKISDDVLESEACVASTNGCMQDFTEDVSYGLSKVNDDVISRDARTATTTDSEYPEITIDGAREALRNINGKMAAESGDEFDTEACIVSTQDCVQIFADDVKNVAEFAQSKVKEMKEKTMASTDDDIIEGGRQAHTVNTSSPAVSGAACVAGTYDCMLSFQEDFTYVAGLGVSKLQEMSPASDAEAALKATSDKISDDAMDGTGCVAGTQDCMQSFQDDVAFVAGLGMNTIFPKKELPSSGTQESTLVAEGASKNNAVNRNGRILADDDSGVVAASLDCIGQFKDDLNFGISQLKDMKITELEVKGMLLALSGGLSDPALLAIEADAGSVLTESDMMSEMDAAADAESVLDILGDEISVEVSLNEDSAGEEDIPDIDDLSINLFLEDEASQDSDPEEEEGMDDPVVEELKKSDPPASETVANEIATEEKIDPPPASNESAANEEKEDAEEATYPLAPNEV